MMETHIPMDTIEDLPDELLKNDTGESVSLRLSNGTLEFDLQDHEQQTSEENAETSDVGSTYQIVAQQFVSTGQVQLTLSDGVSIIQTTVPADQLQGLETGEQGIMLQTSVGENNYIPTDVQTTMPGEVGQTTSADNQHIDQSQDFLQTRIDHNQSEKLLQVINQPMTAVQNVSGVHNNDANSVPDTSMYLKSATGQFFITAEGQVNGMENNDGRVDPEAANGMVFDQDDSTQGVISEVTHEVTEPAAEPRVSGKEEKKPDLTRPIEVTDHMEVVVNGKKCLLKVNPDTGQLCAYPLITTGKRRGRPKKSEVAVHTQPDTNESQTGPEEQADVESTPTSGTGVPDQTNSAAEGLLELSNTGPDGVRRSTRSRGKPRTLQEYEVLEISSDDDGADAGDDEVLPSGAVRKKKAQKDYVPSTPIQTPGVPKRGRGRPRRYPRAEDTVTTNQIPAMIIPSGDGQTIMMAPIQGLTNLEAFQEQVKNMPIFQQSGSDDDGLQYLNISSLIDGADGNPVSLQLGSNGGLDETEGSNDVSAVINNDTQNDTTPVDDTKSSTGAEMGEKDEKDLNEEKGKLLDEKSGDKKLEHETGGETQPTIIQIPENLLPMFTQKKDPVKIGLKASDGLLEKLKCQSCDFQAYYEQQYQEHILTHDEVIKCKCCQFVSFEKQDLVEHFKKKHPRCICSFCDHMAEHAYIIKRHTMRHTQIGCKCEVCGKVYKDQYVLKMHVKMVHLPADVLFECNVCGKKFTRKAHLKRHIRIHDPEKPFKCPQCDYRGCEKSDIVKHLLVHEDPKHKCAICNKTFRHIKNRELHMKRHNGQRDYKCGVCDFYGYTFTDIRKHIERKHTDCRPLICDKCGMVFASEKIYKDHKAQCDVFMIEQALSIATSDGGTTQATVQFPSTYTLDGNQHLQLGGQNVTIDKDGHIIVHSVGLPGEGITLTDEQIQAVTQGQIGESDLQSLVSHAQLNESVLQTTDSQSELIDTVQSDDNVTVMHTINDSAANDRTVIGDMSRQVFDVLKAEVQPVLLFKDGDNVTLTEDEEEDTTMDEDEIREETMDGIVSDPDDKNGVNNDQILAMVNLPDV